MVVDLGHTLLMAAYNRREEMNAERVEEDVVRRGRMHVTHQPPTTAAANGGQYARPTPQSARADSQSQTITWSGCARRLTVGERTCGATRTSRAAWWCA